MSFVRDTAIEYPYLPPIVNPEHLQVNGLLYSDANIEHLEQIFKNRPNGVYAEASYQIIKYNEKLYAIYAKQVGCGTFAQINPIQDLKNGKWYAVKIQRYSTSIEKKLTAQKSQAVLENETRILFDLKRSPMPAPLVQNAVGYVIMDYAPGENLLSLQEKKLNKQVKYPDLIWLKITNALLNSLVCELKDYYHCDLKLENIMCQLGGLITIVDFGFAKRHHLSQPILLSEPAGTLGYVAPEIRRFPFTVDRNSDVFSLGTILKELFQGWNSDPYAIKSAKDFYGQIMDPTVFYPAPNAANFLHRLRHGPVPTPEDAKIYLKNADESKDEIISFIREMRSEDASKRPSLENVVKFFDEVEKNYVKDHPLEEKEVNAIFQQEKKNEIERLKKAYEKVDMKCLLAKMAFAKDSVVSDKKCDATMNQTSIFTTPGFSIFTHLDFEVASLPPVVVTPTDMEIETQQRLGANGQN